MSDSRHLDMIEGESGEPAPGDGPARRLWEARERVAELEGLLAEHVERERVLEVEIAAMRRDLDVKVAYCDVLEATADERGRYLEWLQEHYDIESTRALEVTAQLTAERSRLSYRVTQRVVGVLRRVPRPR